MIKRSTIFLGLLALLCTSALAEAVATQLLVRAVSRDAKIIGTGVGGARITIRDKKTGEVLAQGLQEGSTGNTERIMVASRERGATVYGTSGAAGYLATLMLDEPTVVEVTAVGPLGTPQSTQEASKTLLVIPGQHILGEGVLLEIHGFTVTILSPEGNLNPGQPAEVRATVRMTWGCPTEPGGLWNADNIEISARVLREGEKVAEMPLEYAGESSTYRASLPALDPGSYQIQVLASDPANANFGMDVKDLVVASNE